MKYISSITLYLSNEVMNPRGWHGTYLGGDRLVFSTLEYRTGSEKVSLALIYDIANSWTSGEKMEDWIITGGYEVRAALFGTVIACGQANTVDAWKDSLEPETYIRLTLINPF